MKILILAAALTGIWVSPTGDPIEVPCPDIGKFESGRTRLPRGCVAYREGVWLSADRYKDLEVRLREAEVQLETQQRVIVALSEQKDAVQKQLIQCVVQPHDIDCPSTLPPTLTGALSGSLVTLGGCFLWKAYH